MTCIYYTSEDGDRLITEDGIPMVTEASLCRGVPGRAVLSDSVATQLTISDSVLKFSDLD